MEQAAAKKRRLHWQLASSQVGSFKFEEMQNDTVEDLLRKIRDSRPETLGHVDDCKLCLYTCKAAVAEGARPLDAAQLLTELAPDVGSADAPFYVPSVPAAAAAPAAPAARAARAWRHVSADDFDLNKSTRPEDGKRPKCYVSLNECVNDCLEAVLEQLPVATMRTNPRVPPVMLSRCMRGGKTTVLLQLFDELKAKGKNPVFISFNCDSIITVPTVLNDESAMATLMQAIAVALLKERVMTARDASMVHCSEEDIWSYLNDKSDIVLLVDELNGLLRPGADEYAQVGNFLRKTFLDPAGRHMVFSTHVPLTAGIDVLLGKGSGSERSPLAKVMPKSRSMDELRAMDEACHGLTPCEAAYYSYIPSLIYTVKSQPSYNFRARFDSIVLRSGVPSKGPDLEAAFLKEFFSGAIASRSMRDFDSLTEFSDSTVRWVLGYAGLFCEYLGLREVAEQIRDLTVHAKTVESGKDWELITDIALCLRCHQAQYEAPHQLLGLQVGAKPQHVYVVPMPSEHTTPEDALAWWTCTGSRHVRYPYLAVLRPTSANFSVFDSMLVFQAQGLPYEVRGFQNKLSTDRPKKDTPYGIPGVLLRGDAPKTQHKTRVLERWQYLNKQQMLDFLGKSLEGVYPADWPAAL